MRLVFISLDIFNAAKPDEEPLWKAVRLEPPEMCMRCHNEENVGHCAQGKNKNNACHDCHMPKKGLTTYRVHQSKPIYMHNDTKTDTVHGANNIAKYVTKEHRVHTFGTQK